MPWSGRGDSAAVTEGAPATLQISQYPAAETIYRNFLPGGQWPESGTNFIYDLSYAVADSPMPADFMARFSDSTARIVAGTAFEPGVSVERKSGREIRRLFLRSLDIHGDNAEARFFYVFPSRVFEEQLELARKNGQWRILKLIEQKQIDF
jgi:hypothetical protein